MGNGSDVNSKLRDPESLSYPETLWACPVKSYLGNRAQWEKERMCDGTATLTLLGLPIYQCSLMLFIVSSSYGMWLVLLLNCIPFCFASLVEQVNYFVRPFGP